MAVWELIQDRRVSGKGLLQVPTDVRKGRLYVLFVDVMRDPRSRYVNNNWNPPLGRYGTLVFLRNKYVVNHAAVEFEHQCYDGVSDISGQNLLAIKCVYSGLLETFVNLGNALSINPVAVVNTIRDYESLALAWDEVAVVAYADTALQLRLYRVSYDVCPTDEVDTLIATIPVPPVAKVPPGQAIVNLSVPYNRDNNDNGASVPYPGDSVPPPIKPCWSVVGRGASTANTPGTDLVPSGPTYPSWIRANTLTVDRALIVGGYYNGCYGRFLNVDGVRQSSFGASIVIALDPTNPQCPPS